MARWRPAALLVVALAAVLSAAWRADALSVTVTDTECIHEFVPYEGDTVSGNFVVVDHDIFWSSDHPGIDLTVHTRSPCPQPYSNSARLNLMRGSCSIGFMGCFDGIWPSGGLNWGSGAFMIRDPLTRSLVYAPVGRSKVFFMIRTRLYIV